MPTKEWREKNIDKMRAYRRKWYDDNKIVEQEKAKIRQAERRKEFKDWYENYKKDLKCERCGYDTHHAALDFHHRNPKDKKFTIGAEKVNCSKQELLEEIQKCEVICSNCHRILHYEERNNGSMV